MSPANHSTVLPFVYVRKEETESTVAPARMFAGDAGYDLTVSRDMLIAKGTFATIPTNIAIAIPEGMWAILLGRSSTFYRRGLLVNSGVIDSGYRGEILALVYNLGAKGVMVRRGERLFQLILIGSDNHRFRWEATDELPASARGKSGFGSTGVNLEEEGMVWDKDGLKRG